MKDIQTLIDTLSKLPGVGMRASQRITLHLLKNTHLLTEVISSSSQALKTIQTCSVCGNIDSVSPCSLCTDAKRQNDIMCVVEHIEDIWALERTQEFSGRYHVLGGNLSARTATKTMERINDLIERVQQQNINEIILALSSTFDGQTTNHVIMKKLENCDIQISQLAHGVPVGAALDYMDKETLMMAIKARKHFR
ncbi:MAG: recombination mediator RecR [Alphaproteobacteria bacterium]|nr:recombination mediator RecR [Alphaproteobacteria bacterium]